MPPPPPKREGGRRVGPEATDGLHKVEVEERERERESLAFIRAAIVCRGMTNNTVQTACDVHAFEQ